MTDPIRLRDARATDIPALEAVIRGIGLFTPEEADGFAGTLPGHFEGSDGKDLDGSAFWLMDDEEGGAAYAVPESPPGVWNLLFLGVRPEARRRGLARALVAEVERRLSGRGARMLLIDTSTTPAMAGARALYSGLGYERVGEIPDYWVPGDGKLMLRKAL